MTITLRFSYSAFPSPVKTLYSTFQLLGVSRLPVSIVIRDAYRHQIMDPWTLVCALGRRWSTFFLEPLMPKHNVLKPLLPANTQHSYNLLYIYRSHNYSLINTDSHINDCHFIVRLLYKTLTNNSCRIFISYHLYRIVILRSVIKRILYWIGFCFVCVLFCLTLTCK